MKLIPKISPYGDRALNLSFDGDPSDPAVTARVLGLARALRETEQFAEVLPGYDSLVVTLGHQALPDAIRAVEAVVAAPATGLPPGRDVDIPTCYDGPDLATIARSSGLTETGVVEVHAGETYTVCFTGFIPGFAFLSAAPKILHHPRHTTPRAHVPAGSVGIAGWQTGIYGLDSPGGWQIIGRTDLPMFDAAPDDPFALAAGDRVRFVPQ